MSLSLAECADLESEDEQRDSIDGEDAGDVEGEGDSLAQFGAAMDEAAWYADFSIRADVAANSFTKINVSRVVRRRRYSPWLTIGDLIPLVDEHVEAMFVSRPFDPECFGGTDDLIGEVYPYAVPNAEEWVIALLEAVEEALVFLSVLSTHTQTRAQRRAEARCRHRRQRGKSTAPARTYDADPGPPGRLVASSPHLANAPPSQFTASPEWAQVGWLAA